MFYLLPDNRELKLGLRWEITRSKDHFFIFTILSSHGIDIHNIDIDDIDIHCHWHPPNECERCILCHQWNKLIYRNPQLMARNVRNGQILSLTNQQSDACVPTWPDSLIFWPFLPFLPLQHKKKKTLATKSPNTALALILLHYSPRSPILLEHNSSLNTCMKYTWKNISKYYKENLELE